MIKKLKKRLLLIFIFSVMSVFTFVFCLFIYQNIQTRKKQEIDFMERMTTSLVFQLETSSTFEQDLKAAERIYNFIFYLTQNQGVLYQSSIIPTDMNVLIDSFESTQERVLTVYQADPLTLQSSINGTISFVGLNNKAYHGIQANIVTKNQRYLKLFIIKEAASGLDFFTEQAWFYAVTWGCVFFIILILSKYLIHKSIKPTENALQSQKEFIAAASHELKAPLAVIMTSAECICTDTSLSTSSHHYAEIIDSECSRMSKLVQDLLLLSSLDANTWSLNKTNIDVDTLLINIFEKYEPVCSQKDLTFNLRTPDHLLPTLFADFDRLEQILSIFIDNAITYSYPYSSITLDTDVQKNTLAFSIIDHGMGINAKDKALIFERFFCADKSRTQKNHYGLGLSIAKELVEMHQGRIELLDTPGGGCTFKIFIPLS